MKRMIIIRKSPERKFKSSVGRFINCQSEGDPLVGYTFLLFPDAGGEYPPIFTYQVIEVENKTEELEKSLTKYDVNIDGDSFQSVYFLKGVNQTTLRVVGR